MHKTISI